MPSCFVIQPFDQGAFDKRYEDILSPAITDAGLEPYRVDRDPAASIPIEQIEAGIRSAQVCLADVTTDNPNVWFEIGFAIAAGKEIVLVCSASRQRFPFDIQHRQIITYNTDSTSDFAALQEKITKRLKAILSKEARIGGVAMVLSPIAEVEGLSAHELVTLVAVAQNLDDPSSAVSSYMVRKDIEKAGFTRIAFTLAASSLLRKGLITTRDAFDNDGDSFTVYAVTADGFAWLAHNEDKLVLQEPDDDFPEPLDRADF
jgi:hypothetical protein